MPFGLTNALATFQSLMNDVFRPYLQKYLLISFFFNDILIYGTDEESHQSHLAQVLDCVRIDYMPIVRSVNLRNHK